MEINEELNEQEDVEEYTLHLDLAEEIKDVVEHELDLPIHLI